MSGYRIMHTAITLLSILLYLIEIIVTIGILLLIVYGIRWVMTEFEGRQNDKDFITGIDIMAEQERYRQNKENAAHEGFFEESYVTGVDNDGREVWYKAVVPTDKANEFYRAMDQLVDEQIFLNTEEL